MALTLTANTGSTDLYSDFEAGAYLLELRSMKITESQKFTDKEGNPKQQIECDFILPDVADPNGEGQARVRTWLGASLLPPDPNAKSDAGRKGSYLWKLVQVISGHACAQGAARRTCRSTIAAIRAFTTTRSPRPARRRPPRPW
jgi:hypothetical protein